MTRLADEAAHFAAQEAAREAVNAEWREKIEGMRKVHGAGCPRDGRPENATHNCLCGASPWNAALDALLA